MKKNIPLAVLESLEKYVSLKGETFTVIAPDEFLVQVVDVEPESSFYFNIKDYKIENGLKILIDRCPHNKNSTKNQAAWIEEKSLDSYFNAWVNLLDGYKRVKTFYDDPIANAFAEEYYAEFEILEEPDKPFKINQILFLDEYLENIEDNIEKFATEKNSTAIREIKNEVISLRDNLTTQSKVWVTKKLSIIWGKIAKQGTKLIKEFITEAKKQTIQKGVKFIIEHGPDIIKGIAESSN